jgi:hypothetical protein
MELAIFHYLFQLRSQYCEETNPLGAVAATQKLHEIQIVRETIW